MRRSTESKMLDKVASCELNDVCLLFVVDFIDDKISWLDVLVVVDDGDAVDWDDDDDDEKEAEETVDEIALLLASVVDLSVVEAVDDEDAELISFELIWVKQSDDLNIFMLSNAMLLSFLAFMPSNIMRCLLASK